MTAPVRTVPITPAGFTALRTEYDALLGVERPRIVDVIAWAASNGDRSENGDYLYGRKRLREIDRRLAFLAKRMTLVAPIDPAAQPDRSRIFFGATVTLVDADDATRTVTLVGEDEADAGVGDVRVVTLPGGVHEWEVVAIGYPAD